MIHTKIFLLIINLMLFFSALGQDTLIISDKEQYPYNIRNMDTKTGLIKVKKMVDGQEMTFNYTYYDFIAIVTNNLQLAKKLGNTDQELNSLFAKRGDNGKFVYFAESDWLAEDLQKEEQIKKLKKKAKMINTKPLVDSIFYDGTNLNFKWGLKGSNGFLYQNRVVNSNSLTQNEDRITLFTPSIGLSLVDKKKNMHDFSINFGQISTKNNTISNEINSYKTSQQTFSFGVSYQYNLIFAKKTNWKLLPSIGLNTGFGYTYSKYTPDLSSYTSTMSIIDILFSLEPTLNWFLSKKFFLFASIPVRLTNLGYTLYTVDYLDKKNNSVFKDNFKTLDPTLNWIWQVRFGICVKIN